MKKYRLLFMFPVCILAVLASCSKDADYTADMELEDRIFENYLLSKSISVEPTATGLYYIEKVTGTGESPETGDFVLMNYSIYKVEGEELVYSTSKDLSERADLYDSRVLYGPGKFLVGNNIPGIDEGLQLMKEGGSATLLFKSDLGYGSSTKGPIGPFSSLIVQIELIEVLHNPALEEYEKTINYLENAGLVSDSTDFGIYYTEMLKGTGDSIEYGDFVKLSITAKLLDGRIFYQNTDFQLTVGSYEYDLTEGLNRGLTYMHEGGRAIIVVPYRRGFGSTGRNFYNGYIKTPVPPYSTLVYDVSVKPKS